MIDLLKIRDGINREIVKHFPKCTVYINKVPNEFSRPSFFIEYVKSDQKNLNREIVKEEVYFRLTYYGIIDDYCNTDSLEVHSVLMKIFRLGFINVEDRAIAVKASSSGSKDDGIYIDLQFEYYESRTEEVEELGLVKDIENNLNLRRE